ncbi:guanine nucleotide-binding protein G(s) subunit alpha-like [Protopterus annectens]|uniref:guanine nucleotide-binding protein G(s) subunit alpha-like n=1 Tax=Protopterus annectens TaxID=7888 RepID=UPI001CFAB85D|nr:guanine nucleotide-binding protein G(s) subunit alpha-like [Protopterus annectens]
MHFTSSPKKSLGEGWGVFSSGYMAALRSCFSKKQLKRQQKEKWSFRVGKQVLLYGEKNCGKTTVIKQLNYWNYGVVYDDYKEVIKEINSIVRNAVLCIISKLSQEDPLVEMTEPETQCHVEYIESRKDQWSTLSADFFEHAKPLWQDEGVKEWFMQSPEYGAMSFAKYFLDRLDIIKQTDYVPTVQDYFWCKSKFASRPDPDFMIREWPYTCSVTKLLLHAILDSHMFIVVIDCSRFDEYNDNYSKLKDLISMLKSINNAATR